MTIQFDAAGRLINQQVDGATIVFSDDDCGGAWDSVISNSVLKFALPKPPAFMNTIIKNCTIEALKPQKNRQLLSVKFLNCTFKGKFHGIDFGRLLTSTLGEDFGAIEGCDFTQATLDECRFWNVDVSSMKFPGWPHVVIREPNKRAADMANVAWPEGLAPYMKIAAHEEVTAEVIHMPSMLKHVKSLKRPPFTLEEAKAAFEQLGGVGL